MGCALTGNLNSYPIIIPVFRHFQKKNRAPESRTHPFSTPLTNHCIISGSYNKIHVKELKIKRIVTIRLLNHPEPENAGTPAKLKGAFPLESRIFDVT